MKITLTHGTPQDRRIVENFMVAFFIDLSRYDDYMHINPYGLPVFVPPGEEFNLPAIQSWEECRQLNWWVRDECMLYVIRVDGVPAGYAAVITKPPHLPEGVDYELLDFYIAPKFRGSGVGRAAAKLVFDRHHGRWVVYELEKNLPARTFWQRVLHDYTNGNFENRENGTEQRFRN